MHSGRFIQIHQQCLPFTVICAQNSNNEKPKKQPAFYITFTPQLYTAGATLLVPGWVSTHTEKASGRPCTELSLCSWPPMKASEEGGAAQPCCQPGPTPRGQNEAQNLNLQSGKLRVFVLLTGAVERAAKENQEGGSFSSSPAL